MTAFIAAVASCLWAILGLMALKRIDRLIALAERVITFLENRALKSVPARLMRLISKK